MVDHHSINDLFDAEDRTKEDATWRLLAESLLPLQRGSQRSQPSAIQLFQAPLSTNLAAWFIASCRDEGLAKFLSDERLYEIAAEEMVSGRVSWETNIDRSPGVYVFVSLVSQEILKIGETACFRDRIANAHLRYGSQQPQSNLIGYLTSTGGSWPDCLLEQEVTLIMLPMPASEQKERWVIELGLQRLLCPVMK
ncbi:hypothetical protein [Planctellipticum variicoloris]|uniref:hypothetical protein n=1 Tax=Planctellipticum variicoloris TaxID=3064265 RepID=UPI0030137C6A|nr:hypothetical protein SH412_003254 [Planctomycetaceae bacterium SH412]